MKIIGHELEKTNQPSFIFGTPIWHFQRDLPKGAVEWALNVQKNSKRMVNGSGRGGYQSDPSYDFFEIPFIDHIQEQFKDFPLFKFGNWWVNIQDKGDYNLHHTHPYSDLVVIWYLTDNNGTTFLHNPYAFLRDKLRRVMPQSVQDVSFTSYDYSGGTFINAKAGDFIVFPSDVVHEVREHKFDSTRISVSFNLNIPSSIEDIK